MNKLINGKFLALKFCNKLYYWLLVDFNLEEGEEGMIEDKRDFGIEKRAIM